MARSKRRDDDHGAPSALDVCAVADAPDGERVRIAGTVEVTEPVTAPASGEPCGYAELYDAHGGGEPLQRVGERLLVRDASGVARVELEHVRSELLGQVRRAKVAAIDVELHTVEERVSALKEKSRGLGGPAASAAHAELRHLRRIATVLYAMRAQARGRSHGSRSLDEQAAFIEAEREALLLRDGTAAGPGIETRRLEAIVAEGDAVEVEGFARWEAGGAAAGYRTAGKRLVLHGTADAPLRLALTATERRERLDVGAMTPETFRRGDTRKPQRRGKRKDAAATETVSAWWLMAAAILGMVAYWLLHA